MCGIAGIISLNGSPVYELSNRLNKMKKLLKHRGPDQSGSYVSDDCKIGIFNNRLSIVGVEDSLDLPLKKNDSSFLLSFNGEIYNYKELRKDLQYSGYKFQTNTDTEVLLNGLIDKGINFLKLVDGMWGFAFINNNTHDIYLSRDVMGEKPVYYFISDKELIFCSEVAPIIAVMLDEPLWNYNAIVCSFQYRSAPPGETLIKQINRLHGGEMLQINYLNRKIKSSYPKKLNLNKWNWFFESNPSLTEVLELYDHEIYKACKRRFPDEVKFTSTLSGGIDSSIINVMLANSSKRHLNAIHALSTKSSPIKGEDMSELETSKLTANKFNIDLINFFLYDGDSISVYEEESSDCFDGIFCEGTISFRLLAKKAKELNSKVLVLSDGPDELLNGYDCDLYLHSLLKRTKALNTNQIDKINKAVLSRKNWVGKSQNFLNWSYFNSSPRAVRPNHAGTTPDDMSFLIRNSFEHNAFKKYGIFSSNKLFISENLDDAQSISAGYLESSIPDYLNTRSDRGVMKEGIEARLPFLATSLVELFMSTPEKWRFSDKKRGKLILRSLADKYLGPKVSSRQKYGFSMPNWQKPLNQKKLKIKEIIRSSSIFNNELFSPNIRNFVFSSGNERLLWMVFSLAMTANRLNDIRRI